MSRKDYELIAEAFREALSTVRTLDASDWRGPTAIDTAASHVACALQRDNPAFDSQRFMRAARAAHD